MTAALAAPSPTRGEPADAAELRAGAVPPLDLREVRRLGRALPGRLAITREGKLLIGLSLGIGFAAINSGNNLLYLVFALLLSLIIVSGILSELTLRGLRVARAEVPRIFAGAPAPIRVVIVNDKRRFTSLSLEVRELVDPEGGLEQRKGFLLALPPGAAASAYLRLDPARRGAVPSAGIKLSTRFPFGFFAKSRVFLLPARYLVFPRLEPLAVPRLPHRIAGEEEHRGGTGAGDEFHGLRDIQPGDDARTIAWKVSARRDKLVVREFERPATRRVVVALANVLIEPVEPVEAAREELELAISRAASLARALADAGYAVGLATSEGAVSPSAGDGTLARIYAHLAELPLRSVEGAAPAELSRLALAPGAGGRPAAPPDAELIVVLTASQQRAGLRLPVASAPSHTEVVAAPIATAAGGAP